MLRRLFIYALLLLVSTSCGKKEPPRMIERQRLPAPSEMRSVHREGEIVLFWSYPEKKLGAVAEFIVMKSEGTTIFQKIASTRDLSYTDRHIQIGTEYSYKVFTKDQRGKSGEESSAVTVTPSNIPSPPASVSLGSLSDSVVLSWMYPLPSVSFNVYKTDSRGKYPLSPVNSKPLSQASYNDTLDTRKTVYYTVRVITANGDESPGSGEVTASLLPSAPRGLEASVMEDRVVLLWRENPQKWIRGYRVYRAEPDGEFIEIGESRTPSFTDKRILTKPVRYKVKALAPVLEGPFSEPVEVAPLISAP